MTEEVSSRSQRASVYGSRGFWLLLIGVVVWMQWPALKELYYQISGAQFPEQTIRWQDDYAHAMQLADEQQKPVLAVFGASWCPPCRAMKREVWPNPQVSQAVESQFVPLYIDVDQPTQAGIVSQYRVRGIPTVLMLDSHGHVLGERKSMSVSETLEFLTL